jgi:hypothetical protein
MQFWQYYKEYWTFGGAVIDQNNFGDETRRRSIEDAVQGSKQRRPCFVAKRNDDTDVRKRLAVFDVLTPDSASTSITRYYALNSHWNNMQDKAHQYEYSLAETKYG